MIDGNTNHHIWAERYDRSLDDIFEVQDDLTNRIMNALIQKIATSSLERALRRPPKNMAAYDHYLRAMALTMRLSKGDNLLAQQEAEKAVELDPTYARGHMAFARARIYDYMTGWSEDRSLALGEGRASALKAIDCDKTDFWGYTALAMAELLSNNHDRALTVIDDAIRLCPNSADVRAIRAIVLNFAGDPEQALQEAIPYPERLLNAGENVATWRTLLTATYMALGREAEARTEVARAVELLPSLNITDVLTLIPMRDNEVT